MIWNYLKIAFRHILRQKRFSFINIIGLSIGMTVALLIFQFVLFEWSYDKHHSEAERIYRVNSVNYNGEEMVYQVATSFNTLGEVFENDLPEVESYTRAFYPYTGINFIKDNSPIQEEKVLIADPSILKIFGNTFIKGNAETALQEPFSIVLSAEKARVYFGEEDAMGKILEIPQGQFAGQYKVTGIIQNQPQNTHLKYDMLIAYQTFLSLGGQLSWNYFDDYVYIKLKPNTNLNQLKEKLPLLSQKYLGDRASLKFELQAITEIHLNTELAAEPESTNSATTVDFLAIISLLILVIAWVNFINLSTARSVERAREVGVRKVIGAKKSQLVFQFMLEAFSVNFLAGVLTLILIFLSLPGFSNLTLMDTTGLWLDPEFWISFMIVLIPGAILPGIYPAFVLSGFLPIKVLKGKFKTSSKGILLRKSLVIIQFSITLLLLTGTLVVYQQISYMQNQKLGVNLDQVLVVKAPIAQAQEDSLYQENFHRFKNETQPYHFIKNITSSASIPGGDIGSMSGGLWWDKNLNEQRYTYYVADIDENFLETYEIDLIAGRNFSDKISSDSGNVLLLNETATALLGFAKPEDAVNETLVRGTRNPTKWKVVGVIRDYHHASLKDELKPIIYRNRQSLNNQYYSLKIEGGNVKNHLATINEKWAALFPQSPFQFFFQDEQFNQLYQSDKRFGKVFGIFALLGIFIACLGLYGLTAYLVVNRLKEISVRKVLGATILQLFSLLSKDFLKLIFISCIIAIPISNYLVTEWLKDYAYKMDLSWSIFLLPALLICLIAFLAISKQTLQAAFVNPTKVLKSE